MGCQHAACHLNLELPVAECCNECYVQTLTKDVKPGAKIVVNLSGRGDKDVNTAMEYFDSDGNVRADLADLT